MYSKQFRPGSAESGPPTRRSGRKRRSVACTQAHAVIPAIFRCGNFGRHAGGGGDLGAMPPIGDSPPPHPDYPRSDLTRFLSSTGRSGASRAPRRVPDVPPRGIVVVAFSGGYSRFRRFSGMIQPLVRNRRVGTGIGRLERSGAFVPECARASGMHEGKPLRPWPHLCRHGHSSPINTDAMQEAGFDRPPETLVRKCGCARAYVRNRPAGPIAFPWDPPPPRSTLTIFRGASPMTAGASSTSRRTTVHASIGPGVVDALQLFIVDLIADGLDGPADIA